MRHKSFRKAGACLLASALAVTMVAPGLASAATNDSFWSDRNPSQAVTPDSNLLKTYGVRAGSAGGDFVGVTNTNYDFTSGKASQSTQYQDFTAAQLNGVTGAGLALWATSVNEVPNPYYANLVYNTVTGGTATAATTWMSNPGSSAWGDSNGQASTINGTNTATIAGLEYQPDIIFGANKTTNWDANGKDARLDVSSTNIGKAVANHTTGYGDSYNPTFVNNDSTNLWTQVYTINNLAKTADKLSVNGKKTRYNNSSAITGALAYEKALRGNLLYIASQIDQGKQPKKTVAYLYAIDGSNTGYFFIPEAKNLTNGTDTGQTATSDSKTPDTNYAGNNGTIDLDYMDTLPFITNTFKNGAEVKGGIVMKVEDIYKSNPAVSVKEDQTDALKGVDAIIFNTNTKLTAEGTSGGKNESRITNKETLTKSGVETWAKSHGFTGSQIIAGDDWGTSTNQGFGTTETTEDGMSPLLYCQRNYTTDKPARAAWAYSQLYPELYPNPDASYAYWVKNVYHINMADVPAVVKYFTNQSDTVTYDAKIQSTLEKQYQTGLDWWLNKGSKSKTWNQYAYYNGSSRASYYGDGSKTAEEPKNTIGIFAPSAEWAAKATPAKPATVKKKTQSLKVSVSKKTIKYKSVKKKAQTAKIKVKKAKGKVSYAKAKKTGNYKKVSVSKKGTITFKKGTKKGTYKFKVKAKSTKTYKASKTYTVSVKVK